ncbi:Lysine-specific demethylase 8 [Morella rubra]|uniref:Lysine-specific demethylase 8 n=1 Tax=Morella rubra TaxID=262757 RepID=A0A6A1VJB8_9ROSI|nr:Lysine-specific demethylase 8 [Morella rubra]KAB1227698.1 Lysine-specific demethylase 8 [Morella rubra]
MSSPTTNVVAAESWGLLETPTMDAETPTLLQAITEHGGYAYVSMASLAAAGDLGAAEAAREMAWEQLHSGPWHSVLPVWRDAYSMACLHVARLHFSKGELTEALRVLDMGLIMGGTLLRKDLDSAVEKVSAKARHATGISEQRAKRKLVREDELDEEEVLCSLPVKSLSLKLVEKRPALSLEGFLREHFLSGSPVIISDCMAHWPARTKWNDMDYLRRVAGERTVPVEVGKNYLCPEWKQELISFSQFLARIEANDSSLAAPTYLAQHPLFDQVVGRKYIRLYPASLSEELYPYTETMLKNSSQVDLDNIDERLFPKVHDLEFQDCILEEGEMLYIPPKWWHFVRSLTTSFSVSFWWSDSKI